MRWHTEILIETVLVAMICWKRPGMTWWQSMIGVAFVSDVVQLVLYRAGMPMVAASIWTAAVVMKLPLAATAVVEAGSQAQSFRHFYHIRILGFYLAARMTGLALQTQAAQRGLEWINHGLMVTDSAAFIAWIALLFS